MQVSGLKEPKEQTQDLKRKTMFNKKPKKKVEIQGECRRWFRWSELLADQGLEKIGWLAGRQAGWLAGWLVGWLAGWLAGWPAQLCRQKRASGKSTA